MIKCCLFFLLFLRISHALNSDDCQYTTVHPDVCKYMSVFGKNYSNHTELHLRAVHILKVNTIFDNGVEFGHTSRSDRFKHELKRNKIMNTQQIRQKIERHSINEHQSLSLSPNLPPIDWRNVNGVSYVTPVLDQGDCGGCFAFAAASVLEYWSKKHGHPQKLSVQHLMDCTSHQSTSQKKAPNDGCDGGLMEFVFEYGQRHSIVFETLYPYVERNTVCPKQKLVSHIAVVNWKVLEKQQTPNAEQHLERILHKYGPVSVGVDSSQWDNYKSGIYKHQMCTHEIDHAVTIVGYTPNFWIIKNSWGTDWGMDGYIHLERGHNACGVAEYIAYVTSAYPIIADRPSEW